MTTLDLLAPLDGWICPLDEVPDAAFAGRLLGDGLAIDPLGDTLCAPAPGTVVAVHAAGHAVTLRLGEGLELLLHFGLETVRLGGDGFTPLVREGQQVAAGDPLLRVDVGAVVGRVKSLVTPMILVEAAGWAWEPALREGAVAKGALLGRITGAGVAAVAAADAAPSHVQDLRVPLAHGLHARPSAKLAECARGFDAQVWVEKGERRAAITSPSAMLRLGVAHGDAVRISASGGQAQDAIAAIAALIEGGMGEFLALPVDRTPAPVPTPPVVAAIPLPVAPQAGDRLGGVMAAGGMAVGTAWPLVRPQPAIATTSMGEAAERAALAGALDTVRAALAAQGQSGSAQQQAILAAHQALLGDDELIAAAHAAIARGASAGQGWRAALFAEADALRAMPDPRFAERAADVLDLERRVQWALCGGEPEAAQAPHGAILIADDLMPSEVAALDISRVVGLATAKGGPTSHVAIIAASRGLPALVALGDGVLALAPGTPLVLDADGAGLDIAPAPEKLARAQQAIAARAARRAAAQASAHQEGRTACGTRIEVFANLGKLADAAPAVALGAEGCGLLRTEFLFLDRASAPTEDEQAADYTAIADALDGRPLIIRLLDIGGDKPAPYLPIGPEENPALGLRGLRVGLARRDVLVPQVRAILRASAGRPVQIMAPMVARIEELRALRAVCEEQAEDLGIAMPDLGVMVETPAAAILADTLAGECAFLSIGTNDLTQYTLAMDRGNPAVAAGVDGLDPAVLRLIGHTCNGGARAGKWVGVCGGLASDPLAVPILIGLGVTELSAAPAMVAEVKALVRALRVEDCRALADRVLVAATAGDVRALAGEFLEGIAL